jgi:hypothetical protein
VLEQGGLDRPELGGGSRRVGALGFVLTTCCEAKGEREYEGRHGAGKTKRD